MGIAEALGYQFSDKLGNILSPIGENLLRVDTIVSSGLSNRIKALDFEVVCDVNNPFFGENGAAHVYARQKGADKATIQLLDQGLRNIHQVFLSMGFQNVQIIPGAGAAGGIGGGLKALFEVKLLAGIDLFIRLFDVEEKIKMQIG